MKTARSHPLYLDHHATTPLHPGALERMIPYLTADFGNAESEHVYGWRARAAIDEARAQVANLIGGSPSEIIFTSGATESTHLAILGFLETQGAQQHLITAETEHKATLEVCARAKRLGHEVTILAVDSYGQIDITELENAIQENTVLVSLMHANNEIGTLHKLEKIGPMLFERGITLHVDAAQTTGRHAIDVKKWKIGLLSMSGHKLYGPKGVGALYVRRDPKVHLSAFIVGGGQERGLRGGTANVPGIVGLGAACEIAAHDLSTEYRRLCDLRDHMINRLVAGIPTLELNGHPSERLCNNINVTIKGVSPELISQALIGVAYSSASACAGAAGSYVLKAIGHAPPDPFTTTLRFGLGRSTSFEQVETVVEKLLTSVQPSSAVSGTYKRPVIG